MKIGYVRILSAVFALAAFGAAARAQAVDQLIVNIPYEFVAAGKTLPAGTYTVRRISTINNEELSLSSFENRTGVLLVSSEIVQARDNKPTLTFEQVGDQHFLSKIETAEHIFTIPVSKKNVPVVAKNQNQSSPSTSGSSGSN